MAPLGAMPEMQLLRDRDERAEFDEVKLSGDDKTVSPRLGSALINASFKRTVKGLIDHPGRKPCSTSPTSA